MSNGRNFIQIKNYVHEVYQRVKRCGKLLIFLIGVENYTSHHNMRNLHDNFRTIILVLLFESSNWMWNESFESLLRKCQRGQNVWRERRNTRDQNREK